MHRITIVLLVSTLLSPGLLLAHGPSRQKVVEEINIQAPAAKVWNLIADFCSIQVWHPQVTACTSSDGSAKESIRTLTFSNGQSINEKLIKHMPDKMRLQYMMVEPNTQIFPINTHGSTISIQETDDGNSVVQWKGAFYRSFPGTNPPPEQTDAAGKQAISKLYMEGLQGIKQLLEK